MERKTPYKLNSTPLFLISFNFSVWKNSCPLTSPQEHESHPDLSDSVEYCLSKQARMKTVLLPFTINSGLSKQMDDMRMENWDSKDWKLRWGL
jgi:hypothetical protein